MLKPAVCARELCVFAFSNLNVMGDAADSVSTAAEVVDLLIAMAKSACKSPRKTLIFDPFPIVVDPENPGELAFNPKAARSSLWGQQVARTHRITVFQSLW